MSEDSPSKLTSVLGSTALVLGNVEGRGDLEVRGRVQGNVRVEGSVTVSDGGSVLGTIEAITIRVAGSVRGDLIASDGAFVLSSGDVEGNLMAPRVGIEAGARVQGSLRTGERKAAPANAARARPTPAVPSPAAPNAAAPAAVAPSQASPAQARAADERRPEADEEDPVLRKRRRRRRRGGGRSERGQEGDLQVSEDEELEADHGPPRSADDRGADDRAAAAASTEPRGARLVPRAPLRAPAPRTAAPELAPAAHPPAPGRAPAAERAQRRSPELPTFVKGTRGSLRGD
jgi:cytoskeletal protein CcmA (bactofilin family)